MAADCCAPRRRLLARVGLAYTPAALLALLLPKCPLCLAALLAPLGIHIVLPSYSYAFAIALGVVIGTLVVLRRVPKTTTPPTAIGGA